MTDASYAHIAIVADRSYSMSEVADPPATKAQRTTEGVHALVREQREQPGRATFSLTDFDTTQEEVEWFGSGAGTLAWKCKPRNGTALLDAVGTEINRTGEYLKSLPEAERPGRVFFVIGTDGEENSSHQYTLERLKGMVEHQREAYKWEFIFLGADIDAFSGAAGMGMNTASAMPYAAAGMAEVFLVTSDAISSSRAGGQSVTYSTQQRQRVADAGKSKK